MRHRVLKCALVAAALVASILPLGLCAGPPGYYLDKYDRVEGIATPTTFPSVIEPEQQTEPHTCGVHAIRSIYRAYAIDPDDARLRFRLGADKALTNFTPDLVGTIHPDILRVLAQDGFRASIVIMGDAAPERIRDHLADGHPVLGLVKVGDVLHWIVIADIDHETATIVDSLEDQPYQRDFDAYVHDELLNAILIRPE